MTAPHASIPDFSNTPMPDILRALNNHLQTHDTLTFYVTDPNTRPRAYSGEHYQHHAETFTHYHWQTLTDIAETLRCHLTITHALNNRVAVTLTKLESSASWHAEQHDKYGASSAFQRVHKLADPVFVTRMIEALSRLALHPEARVLALGCNRADELRLFEYLPVDTRRMSFTGIDVSPSALELAKESFPQENYRFICADVNALEDLNLGRFDVIMSIGTLQSPAVNDRALLRQLVQSHVTPRGGLLLGFPNSRYQDGTLLHGAKMKNFQEPDLSLLIKDLAFYRKYLHQHKFKTFITGKYYLLLTATRVSSG